jgi:hypothetical protein
VWDVAPKEKKENILFSSSCLQPSELNNIFSFVKETFFSDFLFWKILGIPQYPVA